MDRHGAQSEIRVTGTVTRTFLPRCQHCHSPHPIILDPSADGSHCLKCSEPMRPTETHIDVEATPTGFAMWLGLKMIGIGNALGRLANKLKGQ